MSKIRLSLVSILLLLISVTLSNAFADYKDPAFAMHYSVSQGVISQTAKPYKLPTTGEYISPTTHLITAGPQVFSVYGDSKKNIVGYFNQGAWQFSNPPDDMVPDISLRPNFSNFLPFYPKSGKLPAVLLLGKDNTYSSFDGNSWLPKQQVSSIPISIGEGIDTCMNGVCVVTSPPDNLAVFSYVSSKVSVATVSITPKPDDIFSITSFNNYFYLLAMKSDGTPIFLKSSNGTNWVPAEPLPKGAILSDDGGIGSYLATDGNILSVVDPGCVQSGNAACPLLYYMKLGSPGWNTVNKHQSEERRRPKPRVRANAFDQPSTIIHNGYIWVTEDSMCPSDLVDTNKQATVSIALKNLPDVCNGSFSPKTAVALDKGDKLFILGRRSTDFYYADPLDATYHLYTDAVPANVSAIDQFQYIGQDPKTGAQLIVAIGAIEVNQDIKYASIFHDINGWKTVKTDQYAPNMDGFSELSLNAANLSASNLNNLWGTFTIDGLGSKAYY